MTEARDNKSYAFLMPTGPNGEMDRMDLSTTRWTVAVARPREGSHIERELSEAQRFDDVEDALRAFIALMREDLPGVVDSPNLRVYGQSPESIFDDLTDAMHEVCDLIPEEDQRDDDWDNTEFSNLRDTMQDILEEQTPEP